MVIDQSDIKKARGGPNPCPHNPGFTLGSCLDTDGVRYEKDEAIHTGPSAEHKFYLIPLLDIKLLNAKDQLTSILRKD